MSGYAQTQLVCSSTLCMYKCQITTLENEKNSRQRDTILFKYGVYGALLFFFFFPENGESMARPTLPLIGLP